jgi:catechol 2,3-dioxygenase-like lactoylglutathione lyase family enzyme
MAIAQGPVTQLAWVTENLDATAALLSRGFGVGEWTRLPEIHFDPEHCRFRGRPADFVVDVALAYAGELQLELIQPVRGESIYTEFLARSGPGLHHLCFEVDDLAAARESALAEGLEVVQAGSMMGGAMEFAYLDGSAHGVPYVELARIGPELRAFFDAIRGG